ncbi:DNA-directed RNA polymerase subunit omega [Calditerrivibrio nitroreducens]|uniref:DNA-directed RNA polymerase subunit omega n=1 Tax=Calditerrivibrio nitroreducens (strain DSM 19672 / NBRC 101217 / Yu37-1) TaxID=768670 RepID=E4THZ6_CALNY|nr:DNA-directed RNA polymerase subunit omega [Calditerrivibrio nitroreducens]ADR18926.1 DNA-directed RNA polymerase, omega subunit [Calditerrivibrio nitroreducens DSM 19672]
MAIVDIEKGIKNEFVKSRFRLVLMASQRARELINMKENTLPQQDNKYQKPTTIALAEIVERKIKPVLVNE